MINLKDILQHSAGILLCAALAVAATVISKTVPTPFPIPAMMLCLFLGMAGHSLNTNPIFTSGIHIASKTLLRLGIVLVGVRIAFDDFGSLGWPTIVTIIGSIALVIGIGIIGARLLKLDRDFGFLIGGATAICGASAAMALSALLPATKSIETKTAQAIILVSAIGTVAMIAYPFLLGQLLPLNDHNIGLVIGGTIHDVGQVVGAGYTVSPEAGDAALLVKLIRVAMLAPVLLICGLVISLSSDNKNERAPIQKLLPLFLIGFAMMAALNSFALIPESAQGWAKDGSSFLLKTALVGIGLKTSFNSIKSMGWKPIALVSLSTLVLLGLYIGLITSGLV